MGHRLSRWLADACALIGFYRSAPNFPAGVRALLENETGEVAVAATTVWEIGIKTARGKLVDIRSGGHATLAACWGPTASTSWPSTPPRPSRRQPAALHADPFDRALVAWPSAPAARC